jgi:hypothetical protein
MIDTSDDRLNRLFTKARSVENDVFSREDGFEGRFMVRLHEQRSKEKPWFVWAWRSAPLFTAVVLVLMTVSGVQNSAMDSYFSHALTGGYEEFILVSYYTGE